MPRRPESPHFATRLFKRRQFRVISCAMALAAVFPCVAHAQPTLQRVLAAISNSSLVSAHSISANIAETVSTGLVAEPRTLTASDRVIIGYDTNGAPVEATADIFGLTVTAQQAAALGAGVPPGFYPAGSRLFALPSSVQVSLFDAGADGSILAEARVLTESRIDGRITNRISRILPDDLARVAAVATDETALTTLGMIGTTTLGAVNAGTIVTDVVARYDPDATRTQIDLAMAGLAIGAAGAVSAAETSAGMARRELSYMAGGSADTALAMLNIATSRMNVTGAVLTIVQQQSLRIEAVTTTALGALSGGQIRLE